MEDNNHTILIKANQFISIMKEHFPHHNQRYKTDNVTDGIIIDIVDEVEVFVHEDGYDVIQTDSHHSYDAIQQHRYTNDELSDAINKTLEYISHDVQYKDYLLNCIEDKQLRIMDKLKIDSGADASTFPIYSHLVKNDDMIIEKISSNVKKQEEIYSLLLKIFSDGEEKERNITSDKYGVSQSNINENEHTNSYDKKGVLDKCLDLLKSHVEYNPNGTKIYEVKDSFYSKMESVRDNPSTSKPE